MEQKVAQFNNFTSGITSELRSNYEVPKFARLWNLDVSEDRAIQNYGFENLLTGDHHLVEYNPNRLGIGEQWFLKRNSILAIPQTGNATFIQTDCDLTQTSFDLGQSVEMQTVPIVYNEHIVWLSETGTGANNFEVWVKPLSGGQEFPVLQNLTANEANIANSFFLKGADGKLYVFSGSRVHRVELPDSDGVFNSGNELAPFQPISQYMRQGDRNGNQGTYTGTFGPEEQIITQIDEAQNILRVLGYYESSVDGVYGPATRQAVRDFQSDYNATGNVIQNAGAPLAVDGIIGPETQAVLNATDDFSRRGFRERKNVLVLPDQITAVTNNGGYINIATRDRDGNAIVYYWDRTLTAEGVGDIGLATSVIVGQGIIQILKPLQGRLMAIMAPGTTSECSHKYSHLSVYAIQAGFDLLPESYAVNVRRYRLRHGDGTGTNFDEFRFNYVNQKSLLKDNLLYFSGRIHLQHYENNSNDEGAFSGVMSIDVNGNLTTHVSDVDNNELTSDNITSFGLVDNGFVVSQDERVKITHSTEDNFSGLITQVISGGQPWRDKQIENIYVAFDKTEELRNVKIFIRDMHEVDNNDAGWRLIYDNGVSEERRDFENRIHINRNTVANAFGERRFKQFREIQVRLEIDGRCVELLDLTVVYNMLDLNK